jgi:AcrR family transcriptional regulator
MPRPLPARILADTGGDAAAIRNHILDAAHRVVSSQGLAAASTRAIAVEAGLGAGTLYNYFDDRLQLLAQSILRRATALADTLADLPARAGLDTVAENLRRTAGQALTSLDELVPIIAAAFSDPELLDAFRPEMARQQSSIDPARTVEQYLVAERDLGRVRADADCGAAASLLISLCHDVAVHRFLRGDTSTPRVPTAEVGVIASALTGQLPPTRPQPRKRNTT